MDEQTAEELGRQARAENRHASPLCSPEMASEIDAAQVGEKTHLMKAFSRGWHRENHRITDQQLHESSNHE